MTRSAASPVIGAMRRRQRGRVVRPVGVHLDHDRGPARRARRRTRRGTPCPGPACAGDAGRGSAGRRRRAGRRACRSRRASCRRRRAASRRAGARGSRPRSRAGSRPRCRSAGRPTPPRRALASVGVARFRRSSRSSVGRARGPGLHDHRPRRGHLTRTVVLVAFRPPALSVAITRIVAVPSSPERTANDAFHDPSSSLRAVTVTASRPGWRNVTRGFVDSGSTERNRTTQRLARLHDRAVRGQRERGRPHPPAVASRVPYGDLTRSVARYRPWGTNEPSSRRPFHVQPRAPSRCERPRPRGPHDASRGVRDPERRLRVARQPPREARGLLQRCRRPGTRGRRSRRGPSPSGRGRASWTRPRRLPAASLTSTLSVYVPSPTRCPSARRPSQVAFQRGDVGRLPGADEPRSLEQLARCRSRARGPSTPAPSCPSWPSPFGENAPRRRARRDPGRRGVDGDHRGPPCRVAGGVEQRDGDRVAAVGHAAAARRRSPARCT